jgi:hypothetical protein
MPSTFQYWRMNISATTLAGQTVAVAEFQLLDTNNVNLVIGAGGTASATSASSPASNAFDGNPGSCWVSSVAPFTTPQVLEYAFTGPVNVVAASVRIAPNNFFSNAVNLQHSPATFTIESSPDNVTWTTRATVTTFNWEWESQIVYFDVSTTVGDAHVSQVAVEIVDAQLTPAKLSQVAVEVLLDAEPNVKVSQINVETLFNATPNTKLSQLNVEIIYPFVAQTPQSIIQFLMP